MFWCVSVLARKVIVGSISGLEKGSSGRLCGVFSLLLHHRNESEHGTRLSIWEFPITATGKILIGGPNGFVEHCVQTVIKKSKNKQKRQKSRDDFEEKWNPFQSQQWVQFAANSGGVPTVIRTCKKCSQILLRWYEPNYWQHKSSWQYYWVATQHWLNQHDNLQWQCIYRYLLEMWKFWQTKSSCDYDCKKCPQILTHWYEPDYF